MSSGAKNSKNAKRSRPPTVTPSPQLYSPDGPPLKLEKEVAPAMRKVNNTRFCRTRELYSARSRYFANDPAGSFAEPAARPANANVGRLGRKWFDLKRTASKSRNCCYEFAHEFMII